jgi:hypothetical protein
MAVGEGGMKDETLGVTKIMFLGPATHREELRLDSNSDAYIGTPSGRLKNHIKIIIVQKRFQDETI